MVVLKIGATARADICDLHGFLPCEGPVAELCYRVGRPYLKREFPLLDYVITGTILE